MHFLKPVPYSSRESKHNLKNVNQQRHSTPRGTRPAIRAETMPSSPLLRPGDPPTGRERIRLFPNRRPSNCGRSASLSPVPCHPSARQFVPTAVRRSVAGPASADLKSKKTPMIPQKSRLIQPNRTHSFLMAMPRPTQSPIPASRSALHSERSAIRPVLRLAAPKPGGGGSLGEGGTQKVPRAKRVQTVWARAHAPAFGLPRLQRRFGPSALLGCGFQLHVRRAACWHWSRFGFRLVLRAPHSAPNNAPHSIIHQSSPMVSGLIRVNPAIEFLNEAATTGIMNLQRNEKTARSIDAKPAFRYRSARGVLATSGVPSSAVSGSSFCFPHPPAFQVSGFKSQFYSGRLSEARRGYLPQSCAPRPVPPFTLQRFNSAMKTTKRTQFPNGLSNLELGFSAISAAFAFAKRTPKITPVIPRGWAILSPSAMGGEGWNRLPADGFGRPARNVALSFRSLPPLIPQSAFRIPCS